MVNEVLVLKKDLNMNITISRSIHCSPYNQRHNIQRLGDNGVERAKKYFSVDCERESLKMILQEAAASID